MRKPDKLLDVLQDTAQGLHVAGLMDDTTLREFFINKGNGMQRFKDFMLNGSAARSAQEATRQASQTADELGLPCAYNKSIHKEPPLDTTLAGENSTPMLTRQITMPK